MNRNPDQRQRQGNPKQQDRFVGDKKNPGQQQQQRTPTPTPEEVKEQGRTPGNQQK